MMKINLTVLDAYQTASNDMANAIDYHNQLVLAGRSSPGYMRLTESEAAMAEAYSAYKVARSDFEDMMDALCGTRL